MKNGNVCDGRRRRRKVQRKGLLARNHPSLVWGIVFSGWDTILLGARLQFPITKPFGKGCSPAVPGFVCIPHFWHLTIFTKVGHWIKVF